MYAGNSQVSRCELSNDSGEGGFGPRLVAFSTLFMHGLGVVQRLVQSSEKNLGGPLLQLPSFPGPSLPPPGVSAALLPRASLDRKSRFHAGILAALCHT